MLPQQIASQIKWTSPTIGATLFTFLLGNLFANFVFVLLLIVAVFRFWGISLYYVTPILAVYYGHVWLANAHVRGWSGNSPVSGFFKRLLLSGGLLSHYFDFQVLIEKDERPENNIRQGKRYLFGYGPHGIHGFGTGIFMDPSSPFFASFPWLRDNIVGLGASVLFWIPLVRELFLLVGWRDASRFVAERVLKKENKSLYIILGGEAEALLSEPGTDRVVLAGKKRQGFVRLALSCGAQLVPVYTYHNTDTYCTSNLLYGFRKWLSKRFQVCIPFFYGRFFTPLPFNVKLTVAVGKPVPWPQGYDEAAVTAAIAKGEKWQPSEAMIEELHKSYISALEGLFERQKAKAGYPPERKLEICHS